MVNLVYALDPSILDLLFQEHNLIPISFKLHFVPLNFVLKVFIFEQLHLLVVFDRKIVKEYITLLFGLQILMLLGFYLLLYQVERV